MSLPTLTPASTTSAIVLTQTGSVSEVNLSVPYKIYSDPSAPLYSTDFLEGAKDQVSYVYKKLGGDILDIELTAGNVYTAYEEAVLEYSYLVNLHQATNILSDALGNQTGSFDSKGNMKDGDLKTDLAGTHVALKYPKFDYSMTRRIGEGIGSEIGLNSSIQFSASFDVTVGTQDYDLQDIISKSDEYKTEIGNKKILIKKVFYKTPHAMWRFYGYYGGLNVVGNLHNYGQFSDDSTFQLIPAWHNKAQAMAFEDAIYTRMSHYSYELRNNKIRLHPRPYGGGPEKMWIEFSIPKDVWDTDDPSVDGVNNMNTLPVGNLPFENINSIGKQWIRKYGLALSKELLGIVRSKYGTIPIPNSEVSLDGDTLRAEATAEKDQLIEQLREMLDQTSNKALMEADRESADNLQEKLKKVPYPMYIG